MEIFKWMEEVRIEKGYNRSCIYDLPRTDYQFVPNEIQEFVKKFDGKSIDVIHSFSENEKEWFNEFLEKEYVFSIPKSLDECFVPLNLDWDHPSTIVNAIIFDNHLEKSLQLLDDVLCKQLIIICDYKERVKEILTEHFAITNFQGVNFVILESINEKYVADLKEEFPVLGSISQEINDGAHLNSSVSILEKSPFMNIGIELFTESQSFHTYFNRKVYIDRDGNIKNSVETNESFANISEVTDLSSFLEIIHSEDFKKIGNVPKIHCDVCKDCELKHMCVDNRIPIERSTNEWYHDTECNYNPYIGKWKGEQGYLSLSDLEVSSSANGFCINHDAIIKINQELWAEEQ